MDLCSNGHAEICHDERVCPLCEKLQEIKDLEHDLKKVQVKLDEANDQIREH